MFSYPKISMQIDRQKEKTMFICKNMASHVMSRIGFSTNQPRQDIYILHYFHNKMRFKCQCEDKQITYDLEPNACVLIDKNTYFSLYSILDHPVSYSWMMIDCSKEEMLKTGIEFGRPYYPTQHERMFRVINELDRMYLYKFGSDQFKVDADKLIQQILKFMTSTEQTLRISSEQLENKLYALRNMMVENPGDKWSVSIMAKSVNLSLSYFANLYKGLFGMAPIDDLIAIRIEVAKKQMLAGENLTDIAYSLGYSNYTHFSRQFKKIEGVPPVQWKKYHRMKKHKFT